MSLRLRTRAWVSALAMPKASELLLCPVIDGQIMEPQPMRAAAVRFLGACIDVPSRGGNATLAIVMELCR